MSILEKAKVCHLTTVHDPFDDRIFYRECLTLANAGYEVVLIAPADKARDLSGVRIRALPKPGGRLERMTKTAWRALSAALGEHADVYHLHDPELLPLGFVLRGAGKRVIYDAHEDLPNDIIAKQWIPRWLRYPLSFCARGASWLTAAMCSEIICATPRIAQRFPKNKAVLVANYPGPEELAMPPRPFAERTQAAVYIGSLSRSRGILEIVRSLTDSAMPANARLTIAGTFGNFANGAFERRARGLPGWRRVDFLGWQSRSEIRDILQSAKVGLITLHRQQSFLDALPTKLFEYMAAGIPVVASDFPLWRQIIEGAGCGILVDPLDTAAIARAIAFLLNNPAQAESMGLRGRHAVVTQYNWSEQAGRLLDVYRRVPHHQHEVAVGHA